MEKIKTLTNILLKLSSIRVTSETFGSDVSEVLTKAFDADFVTWYKSKQVGDSYFFNQSDLASDKRIRLVHLGDIDAGIFIIGTPKIDAETEEYLIENLNGTLLNISLTENILNNLKSSMFQDDLTGVNNYKSFENKMTSIDKLNDASFCFVDVNGLGIVNNTQGHEAGDLMLLTVATILSKHFRKTDIYRKGGDEFFILCEGLSKEECETRLAVVNEELKKYDYSISYGVSYREECTSITEMIDEADALMYEHKEEFRKNNPSKYMVKKIK